MNNWTDWEGMRHQVAIGGRVVDDSNTPVAGAQVTITAMPNALRQKMAGTAKTAETTWQELEERWDRTHTQADGLYYFLDLPAGRYTLQGVDRRSGLQVQKTVSVAWDKDGNVTRATADLKLPKAQRGK